MHMPYNSNIVGRLIFSNIKAKQDIFRWRHKERNVKRYIDWFIVFQQYKDSNRNKILKLGSLEMSERRWGSLDPDFIVHLPKTKKTYDAITTWVDRLSIIVHFVKSTTNNSSINVVDTLFANILKHHVMLDSIVSRRDRKFTT